MNAMSRRLKYAQGRKENLRQVKTAKKNKNFMAPFYGWGSTASRLQPLRGGSLLFTIALTLLYHFLTSYSLCSQTNFDFNQGSILRECFFYL